MDFNKPKSLAKNSIYNIAGQIIPMFIAVFTIPMLIDRLGTERFGILTLAWMVLGYFSLFDFGIGRAMTKVISEKLAGSQREKESIIPLIWTGTFLMLMLGLLGFILVFTLKSVLVQELLNIPEYIISETLSSFAVLSVSIPVVILTTGFRGILESYQKFDVINFIRLPLGIYTYIAPLIVSIVTPNLHYVMITLIVGRMVFLVIHIYFVLKIVPGLKSNVTLNTSLMGPLLKIGGWMTVSNTISPLLVYLDRFIIGGILTVTALAYYSTPYELITKLLVIPVAIVGVLFPAFSASHQSNINYTKVLYLNSLKYLNIIFFPITFLFVAFSKTILTIWINIDFASHSNLVLQILAIGVFINALSHIPSVLLQAVGRPDLTAKFHLLEAPIYIAILYGSLYYFGITGAAFAWSIRSLIDAILLFYFSYRVIRYDRKILINQVILITILIFILLLSLFISGWAIYIYFVVMNIMFFVIVVRFYLTTEELLKVKGIFMRYLLLIFRKRTVHDSK